MVIIMGVLLIVGFMVVITTIAYRVVNSEDDPSTDIAPATDIAQSIPSTQMPADILLPQGAKIAGMEADGGRLFVHVIYPDGANREEILVFDMATGRTLTKIRTPAVRP